MSRPRSRPPDHRGPPPGRGGGRARRRDAHARRRTRANYVEARKEQFGQVDEVHSVEDRDADGVPVRVYRPVDTTEPSRALVYFHGGGFVVGSVETHDGIARALAKRRRHRRRLGRLPPRARAPVPGGARRLLDGGAAGCSRTPRSSGIDADRIGVGGDSVGGDLATIVARKGRDARHAVRGPAPDLPGDDEPPGHASRTRSTRRATGSRATRWPGTGSSTSATSTAARDPDISPARAPGPPPAAAGDRGHGRGRHPPRRGRGLRAAARSSPASTPRATATTA